MHSVVCLVAFWKRPVQASRDLRLRNSFRADLSLTDAIGGLTSAVSEAERIQTAQAQLSRTLREVGDSISDRQTLLARFALLDEAYRSDLERLDAVEELGSLLGFLGEDTCPFCGAPSTAWEHAEVEGDVLRGLIDSERGNIRLLGSQLQDTLRAMRVDLATDEESLADLRASHDALVVEQAELNERVSPIRVEMRELMDLQSQLRERVAKWDQIAEIEEFRDTLVDTEAPKPSRPRRRSARFQSSSGRWSWSFGPGEYLAWTRWPLTRKAGTWWLAAVRV